MISAKIDKRITLDKPVMKLAIVGSRTFNSYSILENYVNLLRLEYPNINLIISGGAIGADKLGETYARIHNIPTTIYKPDWNKYKKAAGIYRNTDIISNSDIIIAFWDGQSKGTLDSINKAQQYNKILWIINFNLHQ